MEANQFKFNQDVKRFGEKIKNLLAYNILRYSDKGKGDLLSSLRTNYRKNYGEISSLSVRFERHGVYFAKGTGRGYKVISGKVMKVPDGGAVMRKPRDWHNEPVDRNINELIGIVANYYADTAVDATNFKIR